MDVYTNILIILAIIEYVFCDDIVKFKRGSVDQLNLMESLFHMNRMSCARACKNDLLCDGFYYCTEAYCSVTTCMLFTKNLAIGQSSAPLANSQVSGYR